MPRIIGKSIRVVESDGLSIDEFAGNVATIDDRLSIAHVQVNKPTSEPWLTLSYDEWICILKGRIIFYSNDGNTSLEAIAGDTVYIEKEERFRPTFPDGNVEYIPVCFPAFRPDRCIREEEGADNSISVKLATLHAQPPAAPDTPKPTSVENPKPEVLYHMCPKVSWEDAKSSGAAYFPKTFEQDGFTHATAVPSRLIVTANHFYQHVEGDWICLQFTRSALLRSGIVVKDEEAKPVGDSLVSETWTTWVCPHVFGGIPIEGVVQAEHDMIRDGSKFLSIVGLE